jgi:hypothetical protein
MLRVAFDQTRFRRRASAAQQPNSYGQFVAASDGFLSKCFEPRLANTHVKALSLSPSRDGTSVAFWKDVSAMPH